MQIMKSIMKPMICGLGVGSLVDFDDDGCLDLVYIKTSNTLWGPVEVHIASGG